ncbi:MAG TPA: response regulator [Myxococcaceae bacterium]|nr:response regulator [Myxococcaceae bacterium]
MAPTEPVHVLVVDDDRNVQRMLADALTRAGFLVTVERDGEAALAAFDRQPFDVVLLDVLLPALNGYEVARRIKSTPRGERTPVLMLSGIYKTKMHQAQAVERHGAAAFVEKPFKLNQLFGKLEGLLGDRFPKPPPPPPSNGSPEPASEPLADPRARAEASLVEFTAAESTVTEPADEAQSSTAPVSAPAVDRGTFASRAFPELLADLHRRRATGGLLLRRDKVKKIVFFRGGAPESVKSNRLSECLGRVMVRERMISEADCEESLKRMKTSGRQQGTVLIEMGCISPHNLRYALELQLRLKLLEVFGWTKGEFQFNPRAQPPAETVRLQMSTAAIAHEGIKRSYDTARIQRALGEIAGKYVHPAEDPLFAAQDMSLGEEEAGLLALMDGSRTVRELRRRGPLSPLDTDRFLYALLCSQMVELRSERRTGPPPAPPPQAAVGPAPGDQPWDDDEEVLELEDEVPGGDDEGHLRERLLGALAAMRRMDYFELLGLRQDAPPDAVRSAAVELLREYRVDDPASSAEVETVVHQIAELVGKAHDTLVDPSSRARYQTELGAGGVKHEVGEAVGRMLEAESAFRRGEQLLAAGDAPGAHTAFAEAVRLQPEEGEFLALLGWTTHARAPTDLAAGREALTLLAEAVERSPTLDRAHLYKGHVHKALGQTGEAQGEYEKAVECNPGCTEALRELSILTWAARLAQSRPS